jgi:predicted O-methyltransferase YrrM
MDRHPWLTQRYNELCAEESDIHEHLPTFVKAVEQLNATKVIELGVRYGVSTVAWLYALEGRGHLWACDCSFPVPAPGSDINNLDPQGPLGVRPQWNFILGDFHHLAVLNMLPSEVDVIFIDGNHTYEGTDLELELYYPRVRSGGRIFLHDTAIETTGNAVTPQPLFPVLTAMRKFCELHNLEWSNVENCSGLGTICVP